ncbi:hypothetical protein [Mycobacterium basiliense]|nr:hypothetical protein [Mycobacterium basiliense]
MDTVAVFTVLLNDMFRGLTRVTEDARRSLPGGDMVTDHYRRIADFVGGLLSRLGVDIGEDDWGAVFGEHRAVVVHMPGLAVFRRLGRLVADQAAMATKG